MRNRLICLLPLCLLGACDSQPPSATPPVGTDTLVVSAPVAVSYAWVQFTQEQSASARAIVEGTGCPSITINDQTPIAMSQRNIPTSYTGFQSVTVCEHPLTSTTTKLSIDNAGTRIDLPAPSWKAEQVLVVGDTGCRLRDGDDQWCEGGTLDRGGWGFPDLSKTAASGAPVDLILHVGDYLYRQSIGADGHSCDPYDPARGWDHCGDNYLTWEVDFFAPAQAAGSGLLGWAPWIFVRGNHESCTRAWQGYFLFFADGPAPEQCGVAQDVIAPYRISLEQFDIHVVDSANESAESAQQSFESVAAQLSKHQQTAWLATHVPTSDLGSAYAASPLPQQPLLRWIHVGHVHNFRHTPASTSQQAETVNGGGGTALNHCGGVPACPIGEGGGGCCYGKVSHTDAGNYSYLRISLDPQVPQWNASLHDIQCTHDCTPIYTFNVQ